MYETEHVISHLTEGINTLNVHEVTPNQFVNNKSRSEV